MFTFTLLDSVGIENLPRSNFEYRIIEIFARLQILGTDLPEFSRTHRWVLGDTCYDYYGVIFITLHTCSRVVLSQLRGNKSD